MNPQIGVVIATRGRPDHLSRVLASLEGQTLLPRAIIVCDSSDEPQASETMRVVMESDLNTFYIWSAVQSLTFQKNRAIEQLLDGVEVDYVQILDDDTEPSFDHLEQLATALTNASELLGVSGVTIPRWRASRPTGLRGWVLKVSGLYSENWGSVSASGVGIPVPDWHDEPTQTHWLFGCSMWRKSVFDEAKYCEEFTGSAICEDLEFSTRVASKGQMLVIPRAVLRETGAESGRPNHFLHSYMYTRNRLCVMNNLGCTASKGAYVLSLLVLASSAIARRAGAGKTMLGMLHALWDTLFHRPSRSN